MRLTNKHGFNYSRYADDMTFSADKKERLPKAGMIRKIVATEDFRLKEEKTHPFLPEVWRPRVFPRDSTW